jgi:crotonobetainyl-CoA:carnitine CoA-transferase CaiB-like acyl-CoA transferase
VIDLSALWAGPLATSILQRAGAEVVKAESRTRPDSMRTGDPALFARLNGGKASVALDLRDPADRDRLIALIRRAQIVVEAARPRALGQLGIDADALVREVPGLVWISITGHGIAGEAGDWIGFGDDCAIAGGLSAALHRATGAIGFVGDACADPLTGIHAARAALARYRSGTGAHLVLSMSGVVAEALASETRRDPQALTRTLHQWAGAVGGPFPSVEALAPGPVAALGSDNSAWLSPC